MTESHAQRIDERQLRQLLDSVARALNVLRSGDDGAKTRRKAIPAAELLRRSRQPTRDGYPTSSLGGGGGPSTVLDDKDMPMPPVNDPVGELVVGDKRVDPVRAAAGDVIRTINRAANQLAAAANLLYDVTPQTQPIDTDDIWCKVHKRHGMLEPKAGGRGNKCDWCYRFALAEGVDPPKELLDVRAQGKSVTAAMVSAAVKPLKALLPKRGRKVG